MSTKQAPPLTRGWTPKPCPIHAPRVGSPAHAGMDPVCAVVDMNGEGLPRSRGDGPGASPCSSCRRSAPPLTRGWTLMRGGQAVDEDGSPAHAGMDPARAAARFAAARLPRSRGDGPIARRVADSARAAPPLTRGWTQRSRQARRPRLGSPAHAGMDPRRRSPRPQRCRLPRSRGDGPVTEPATLALLAAPPLTRGWTRSTAAAKPASAGSPAHAGMDPRLLCRGAVRVRLPRSRGDGPFTRQLTTEWRKAPPLTRGWTLPRDALEVPTTGSPAHAGMDPQCAKSAVRAARLPRSRGDGPLTGVPSR